MTTKIQSSPLTQKTTYKRLIFNYFKELLTRFYGTAMKLPKRSGTNKDIQKSVRDGMQGVNGGHLIARNTNGPNEHINQVPMLEAINQHGKWRDLERIEEEALKAGKKVVSKRIVQSPSEIKFITIINGETVTDEIVKVL